VKIAEVARIFGWQLSNCEVMASPENEQYIWRRLEIIPTPLHWNNSLAK